MSVHRVLTWMCDRPRGDFTVGRVLRCGWPGFASVVLLPKQLELGRARRLIERVIFSGATSSFCTKLRLASGCFTGSKQGKPRQDKIC